MIDGPSFRWAIELRRRGGEMCRPAESIETLLRKGGREHSTCAKVVDSPMHVWEGCGGSGGPGVDNEMAGRRARSWPRRDSGPFY